MAPFNPQISPTSDPNFTNVTKPISDIPADKSAGMRYAAIGEGVVGTTAIADNITKEVIKDDVRKGVEGYQNDTISVYEQVRNTQREGLIPNAQTLAQRGIAGDDTLTQDPSTIPGGLQAGLSKIQALGTAQAQNGGGGKANDTLYTGAINSLAKQMRSQYPGYKDYVDEQIKSVSGIDPANAYMRNLLQDINASLGSQKSESEKAIALGRQYLGYDKNMPAYIEAVRQGLPGAVQNLEKQINFVASKKVSQENWRMDNERTDRDKTDAAESAKDGLADLVQKTAYSHMNAVITIPGLGTPATIQKLIDDQRNGIITMNSDQKGQLLNAASAARDVAYRDAQQIAADPSTGFSKRIKDPKVVSDIIADKLKPYDQMVDAITNEKWGILYENKRRVDGMNSETDVQLLTDKDIGAFNRLQASMLKNAGPNWTNTAMAAGLQAGYASKYKDFLTNQSMVAQTPKSLFEKNGPQSLYDAVRLAKKAGVPASSRVYDDLISNIDTIVNPDAPAQVKKEVVEYAFNPEKNGKLVSQFQRDFTDNSGEFHPGKFVFYDTMTKPKVVDSIWALKDSDAWEKHKTWQETSFATLFRDEVQNLNKIHDEKSLPIRVEYNSDTAQFSLNNGQYGPNKDGSTLSGKLVPTEVDAFTNSAQSNYIRFAEDAVKNLNRGLRNLNYMKNKEGEDTAAYVVQQLMNLGYSPNDSLRGNNLPQMMIEAVANSKKSRRIEDAFDRASGRN